MSVVYLGLGSNLGDRMENLRLAIRGLGEGVIVSAESQIYETEPWGVEDQPDFLNMCLGGVTKLSPQQLLRFIKQLERHLGRLPSRRWGPRLIDIDILFYDQLVLDEPSLSIPHSGIAQRASVLVPLSEIAPELEHPVLKRTITELRAMVDASGVRLYQGVEN